MAEIYTADTPAAVKNATVSEPPEVMLTTRIPKTDSRIGTPFDH
jgi:hypothetical protein